MKALTPAHLTLIGRSLRLLRLAVPAFRPQPRELSDGRFASRLSANGCFQASPSHEQARHSFPPKQVRHPTDCRFTSGCSPPRLATTQLPSITGMRPSHARTLTVLTSVLADALMAGLDPAISGPRWIAGSTLRWLFQRLRRRNLGHLRPAM